MFHSSLNAKRMSALACRCRRNSDLFACGCVWCGCDFGVGGRLVGLCKEVKHSGQHGKRGRCAYTCLHLPTTTLTYTQRGVPRRSHSTGTNRI